VEVREIYVDLMEQHGFPCAQTCDELFISWSEDEKIPLSKGYLELYVKENVRRGCHMENFVLFKLHLAAIFQLNFML
jgi:hypothetical protein